MQDTRMFKTLISLNKDFKNGTLKECDTTYNRNGFIFNLYIDGKDLVFANSYGDVYHLANTKDGIFISHVELLLPQDLKAEHFSFLLADCYKRKANKEAEKLVYAITDKEDRECYGIDQYYYYLLYCADQAILQRTLYTREEIDSMIKEQDTLLQEETNVAPVYGSVMINFSTDGEILLYGNKEDCDTIYNLFRQSAREKIIIVNA